MDLWIRNQSNYSEQKLIKAEQVNVELVIDDIWVINVNGIRVAEYKSRERAIKVLDEIQDSMYDIYETTGRDGNVLVRHIQPKQDNFIVYQMPADEGVKND